MKSKAPVKQGMQPLLSQHHQNSLFLILCYSLVVLTFVSLAFAHPRLHCHEDERTALLQFRQSFVLDCSKTMVDYDAFTFPNKSTVESWNKHEFVKGNTGNKDCCMWDGVKCDEITGHIIGLELGESCLYGYFPQNSSLFKLIHLQHLNLRANNFKHSLIPQGFGQLSNLKSLDLSLSRFSGEIPLEISRLSNLHSLDISFSGGSTFYGGDKLLKLHNTKLENLVNNLTSLNTLGLDLVDISSTIAPITSHLSNRTSLRWLGLSSTNLIGEFPSSIFQLPNLEYIDISYNDHLTGVLPEFQPNRSSYKLKVLGLSRTRFTGKLPSSIGDRLINLRYISLHGVGFTGDVPLSFANITKLEWLDLSHNNLYGKIPEELIQLTFLEIFNVSYNYLMGPIPQGKQFDTFDISSFVGNPGLCGNRLAKRCKDTDDGLPLPPVPLPSTHDYFDWMDWIVRSLGYGSGLIVGIVGGMIFVDEHREWFMEWFGRRMQRRVKRARRSNH